MKKKHYDFPIDRTHCGIPMGNGNTGFLVWGGKNLHLTVNRSDFWDHTGGDHLTGERLYDELVVCFARGGSGEELQKIFDRCDPPSSRGISPKRLPAGRFEVMFRNEFPVSAELDYSSGKVRVMLSGNSVLELEVPLKCQLLRMYDPGNAVAGVRCVPADEFPRTAEFFEQKNIPPPERNADGWTVFTGNPDDRPLDCRFLRRGSCWFFTAGDAIPDDLTDRLAETEKFWSIFFSTLPVFTLPDGSWNDFFRFCAWKLAAAVAPGGFPAGLQGPWIEEYQPAQWSGDYHFNVNVQMIYDGMLKLGHPEFLMPLFDMIESDAFTASLRRNARVLFGDDSAYWFTHAVDDRGVQVGGLSCGSVLDPVCGAWTALLYAGYWQYTGDREFLKKRAWPVVGRIMRGYELMLDDGLNIPLAISAEYAASNPDSPPAGRNPSYQLAAVRHVAALLLDWAAVLGENPKPVWREILEKVPKFTVISGRDRYGERKAEPHIAIWENLDLEHCHRHHSHLATIYPFPDPREYSADEREMIDNSIDHWIEMGFGQWSEWCMMWAIQIYCRMDFREAPVQMLRLWRELFINEGDAVSYLPRSRGIVAHRRHDIMLDKKDHEIMQLDGTAGFVSAFTAMFCYFENGKAYLFRGIPEKWREKAAFRNIRLPGRWTVSADSRTIILDGPPGELLSIVLDGRERRLPPGRHPAAATASHALPRFAGK